MFPWTLVSQPPKRHLDRFSRFCVHRSKVSQCLSLGRTTFKNVSCPWESELPIDTWFLEPTWVSRHKNGISNLDWFSLFCRARERDQQTDRQNDHATPSVAIGRIVLLCCCRVRRRGFCGLCQHRAWIIAKQVCHRWSADCSVKVTFLCH